MASITLLVLGIAGLHSGRATESSPHTFRERQPDGSLTPELKLNGGPAFHYMTDKKGFTVMEDDNSWLVYASRETSSGRLTSSGVRVGMGNPVKKGLSTGILPGENERDAQCGRLCDDYDEDGARRLLSTKRHLRNPTLTQGTLRNLVVLMRFSDHSGRNMPPISDIDILFNQVGGDTTLAPSGSVKDVYEQSSYGQLHLDSTVFQWITLSKPENYYADNESGMTDVFVEALHEALDQIDADTSFSFTDFDEDADGTIDAITFLHSGYGAEWGGSDCFGTGSNDRIWSHKWTMPSRYHWYSSDGVRVNKYHVSPAVWGTCGSNIGRIGVISHELGHFLGLPDLYDTNGGGQGVGSYCLMANSWGFDGSQLYPPTLSPWSKVQLGWLTPATLSTSGTYALNAVQTTPQAYMIESGFPSGEYLLVENRQPVGFDATLPQGGLVIWHIDEAAGHNQEGHPDQSGWPENGYHYRVALLQADGNYDLERGNGRGDSGDVWHSGGVKDIGPSTSFSEGPFPNTDSYQGGQLSHTGINILDISESKQEMSFRLAIGDVPTASPAAFVSDAPTASPTVGLALNELVTTFVGGNGNFGNMFDVVTKKGIAIVNMHIHTKSISTVTVEVYSKPGSYVGYEQTSSAWTLVAQATVVGQGQGNRTPLPQSAFHSPVLIPASERRAFYVTLTTSDIRYSNGEELGRVFKANEDLEFLEGIGVSYPFDTIYSPRVWNGALLYELTDTPPNSSPTFSPTTSPTVFPTNSPSASPTAKPSESPTATPTASPTTTPSESPTSMPMVTTQPTVSIPPVTLTPTPYPTDAINQNSTLKELVTTSIGGNGQAGNQFDVVASKDLMIVGMSIHTSATDEVTVEVWTKSGSYVGHDKDPADWTMLASVQVQGKGNGQLTPLPLNSFSPVKISSSETQAFYVTLTTAEMRYTNGDNLGGPFVSNEDLTFFQGIGKSYPFKASYSPRVWNGALSYVLQETASPTSAPTVFSTTHNLTTTYEGGNGQGGNMFDIVALKKISIVGMHIHTSSMSNVTVEVFTKAGSYSGFEKDPNAWESIASLQVEGQGRGQRTPLPAWAFDPVPLDKHELRSFYVTLTTPEMRYTSGGKLGEVYASNSDLQFLEGVGKTYPFQSTYKPRVWNGDLLYIVRDE